jgi:hypothetical protein
MRIIAKNAIMISSNDTEYKFRNSVHRLSLFIEGFILLCLNGESIISGTDISTKF